ncbi:MAG: hypothetical protein KC418_10080 [Anaerolineales bacterium]|nr:hypothetical protein [Anaerolineales bacterium]MCB8952182.1 hypothetical protein [Ardenticatenales bacterium]
MYTQLTSWDNLLLAYRKASKGKRGHPNVALFEHRLEDNLLQLQQELQTCTYRPGPYNSFHIHEPKRRLISAAPQSVRPLCEAGVALPGLRSPC